MHNFLKFRYFLIVVLLISCGEKSKLKQSDTVSENNSAPSTTKVTSKNGVILCFGDSLTAGYGLEEEENAFPSVLQKHIDSLALDYTVINAGLSGETTAGGKNRLDWVLNQDVAVFFLELGANDGLRGIPIHETKNNLQFIIDAVRAKNPKTKIVLAGMQIPPNLGIEYTAAFRNLFPELATKNDLALIPFLLKDVAGIPELNQADGIHPTPEGHRIMANTVWEFLQPLL